MFELHSTCRVHAPLERCFDLARSVEVHLLENNHWGESTLAVAGRRSGLSALGEYTTWQARHLGVRQRLTTEITAFDPPTSFTDTMLRGAFQSMEHSHRFRSLDAYTTEMSDILRVAAPFGILGHVAETLVLRRYMRALLLDRVAVIERVAASSEWQRFLP